ncbi:MAG: hypothetical protein ACREMP_02555 [Candidatus Tyrphobacter sp.]
MEQIEVLLLLRTDRDRLWTVDEISRELRSSSESIALRLAQLRQHALVTVEQSGVRYGASPDADASVERLAAAYRDRRPAVIAQIFSRRDDSMQSFADAFRLREEDEDRD